MLLALGLAPGAMAADHLILGNRMVVADPTGLEPKRKIVVSGKELPSTVASFSNPTASGATLTVVVNGGTSSSQTYVLDGAGWKAINGGFVYRGPSGGDGDPVRSVKMKRASSGRVTVKVQIRGTVGVQEVTVQPADPSSDGGIVLQVVGGDRYCIAFGSGAGGVESRDDAQQWKVSKPVAEPGCPSVTTTTVPTTTTSTTLPGPSPLCPADPSRTVFAGGPGTSACRDFEDQPSCESAFHMSACGPASCFWDFDSFNCKGCGPNNAQSGQCVNTCTEGAPSCPGDPTRTIFAGFSGSSACTNLSFSQTLCEKAFHISGNGQPASCYYDSDDEACYGCGPNNLDAGNCQNTCPVCEGDPSRTVFAGGPGNAGCHKFDGAQASCEGAFIMGDTLAYTSCYYDAGSNECRGCGRNNQANLECINSCPVCEDASNAIFLGGPGTSACSLFDDSPSLCEQSFLMSGECNELASCFYDYENGRCAGCGPNNKGAGLCQNECSIPICGNGILDVAGEECDGATASCDPNEICSFDCKCGPCASTVIPAQGGTFVGSTSGGSNMSGSCGSGTDVAPEVIFQWTPATTGQATIDLCGGGTDYDSVVYLRQGSCSGPEVDCDDDSSCGLSSQLFPNVTAGTTYFIVVDGYGGDFGNFTMTVTPASPSGAFLD
jgi:hypothetical protein